jgi:hypothetical protein
MAAAIAASKIDQTAMFTMIKSLSPMQRTCRSTLQEPARLVAAALGMMTYATDHTEAFLVNLIDPPVSFPAIQQSAMDYKI